MLITGDKGLAGAFNSNLIKAASASSRSTPQAQIDFELIGRKGRDFFRKREVARRRRSTSAWPRRCSTTTPPRSRAKSMELFRNDEIDAVYLLYNEFKSVMSQKLTLSRVLPVELPEQAEPVDYIFEQPPAEMLDSLLPRYVEMEVYRALLESAAAEHAARMTAMDTATSNAGEMIDNADAVHEPRAPGQHHQGNHRSGQRRRGRDWSKRNIMATRTRSW